MKRIVKTNLIEGLMVISLFMAGWAGATGHYVVSLGLIGTFWFCYKSLFKMIAG